MERWLKILLGTVFSSIGAVVFFFIYDQLLIYYRKRRHDKEDKPVIHMQQVIRKAKSEELETLIHEEFDSSEHEVLCVCFEDGKRAVGLCIFLVDREIEWYSEDFPDCCVKESCDEDYKYRNLLAAVSLWAPKWTYAEAVNLLTQDGSIVRNVSKGTTRQWRSLSQYEKKHSFRLFLQWSENYVCGEAALEDLWEEALNLAKALLAGKGVEVEAWHSLPVSHWKRRRVRPGLENFHMVPHPGDISSAESSEEKDSVVRPALLHIESTSQEKGSSVAEANRAAEILLQL